MSFILAINITLFISVRAVGGILTPAAEQLSELSKGPCEKLDKSTYQNINTIAAQNSCFLRVTQAHDSSRALEISEEIFFEVARQEQVALLTCEKQKLDNFEPAEMPQLLQDIKEKVPMLKELDELINSKTAEWQLMQGKFSKGPSLYGEEKKNPLQQKADDLNDKIKNLMLQRQMILESIPLAQNPEFAEMIEDLDEKDLAQNDRLIQKIKDSKKEMLERIRNDLSDLRHYKDRKPTSFKEMVMQDPVFLEHLNQISGFDQKELLPLQCHLDARYGSGAKMADNALMIGTTVLTGGASGVLLKAFVNSSKVAKLISMKRSSKVLMDAKSLSAISYSGVALNGVQLYRNFESQCFNIQNQLIHPSEKGQACRSSEFLTQLAQNNCELSQALPILGAKVSSLISPNQVFLFAQKAEKWKLDRAGGAQWVKSRTPQSHYQDILALRLQGQKEAAVEYEKKLTNYMRESSVQVRQRVGRGVGGARYVEYPDGTVGIWKPSRMIDREFKGTVGGPAEVAAYELDRFLGYNRVPVTLQKKIDGESGTVQLLVDGTKKEVLPNSPNELSLFDVLIGNYDRHGGNYLVSKEGHMVAIDHGLSFKGGVAKEHFFKKLEDVQKESKDGVKNARDRMTLAEEKTKTIQNISSLVGEKEPYLKLKETSEREWRLFFKGKLNKSQVDDFLETRKMVIDSVDELHRVYGDKIFRAGPASPIYKK